MSTNSLNILLQILLKTYFFHSRCILLFTDNLNKIDFNPRIPSVYLKINNTLNPQLIFQHYGCQDILISHENATEIFIQFEQLIRFYNERFNSRKYLIYGKNALSLFKSKELDHVNNLLVIVPRVLSEKNEIYDLATHLYKHKEKLNEMIILDSWFAQNKSFSNGYDLYPDKLSNQNGRVLKIATFTYEPYSIVGDDNSTFHGTETSLVFEFIKKHNMTPEFLIIGNDLWGDIYDNWTGIGLLGSIAKDEVDIGYAALYTWEEYYKFLDYTKPLTRTGVTCLVPAPRLAAGWFTPLYSFSLELWIAELLVFLSDTIVLTLILHKNYNRWYFQYSFLTMVKLYLNQSASIPLNGKLMRFFIALNMMNVLLFSSSYGSGLSSVMTVPRYEKNIKTVKDLALSGLPWGAPTDAWLISLRQVEEDDYITIKNNFVVKSEDDLVVTSHLNNFGFSLERLPYGHYAVGAYVKRDIISTYRIMPEDIYWEQCIFMTRKNSVLLPLLDNLILRVFEAGLEAHWEDEVVSQHMDMSVQRAIRYYTRSVKEHITVQLKWVHIEGVFAMLVLGYAVALMVFFIEVITYRTRIVSFE